MTRFTRRVTSAVAIPISCLAVLLFPSVASAHSLQVYTSPGTILYSTYHNHLGFHYTCGGNWEQMNRDSVTEYSTSSLRFNRFEVDTYNYSGSAVGGMYWVLDRVNNENDTPFYDLFGDELAPQYTWIIYTGVNVESSPGYWPSSWFQVGAGGEPGPAGCTADDEVVYNPN